MNVAFDGGYSAVKALLGDRSTIFSSVTGSPVPKSSFSIRRNQKLLAVSGNGHYIPVGETAIKHSNYSSGRRDPEWVLGNEWMILLQAALSELIEVPYAEINLVTGLPIRDWSVFEERLRNRLTGNVLTFKRAGRNQQRIKISNTIVCTQPYGTYLDYALDNNGRIRHNMWTTGRVGIADLGGNTFNLLAVDQLEEIEQSTASDTLGLLRAFDEISDHLYTSFQGFNPSTHEVSEWVARGSFHYGGKDYDIWPYAEPFLTSVIDTIINTMNTKWSESGRFDAVLLTGGGSDTIGRYLKARMSGKFAHVEIASDPRWANARGYYKLAVREFGG